MQNLLVICSNVTAVSYGEWAESIQRNIDSFKTDTAYYLLHETEYREASLIISLKLILG